MMKETSIKKTEKPILTKCKEFLRKDTDQFQEESFNPTKFLVDNLTNAEQQKGLNDLFQKYIQIQNQCDTLISEVIHEKVDKFNNILKKPEVYGIGLQNIRKQINTSKKQIIQCKDSIEQRRQSLQTFYMNSKYNKQILDTLERVQQCQNLLVTIDSLLRGQCYYQAMLGIKKLRDMLEQFQQYRGTVLVKQIEKSEKTKSQELFKILLAQLFKFNFSFQENLQINDHDDESLKQDFTFERYHESMISNQAAKINLLVTDQQSFNQVLMEKFKIDLRKYSEFERKYDQIIKLVNEPIIVNDSDPFYFFNGLSYSQLSEFINFSLKFSDYESVQKILQETPDSQLEILMPEIRKRELLNLMMILQTAQEIQQSDNLLSDLFKQFRQGINTVFMLLTLFFIKNSIRDKSRENQYGMNSTLAFPPYSTNISSSQPSQQSFTSAVADAKKNSNINEDFFLNGHFNELNFLLRFHCHMKAILAECVVLLRKQVILRKAIKYWNINLDEGMIMENISHLLLVLLSEIEMIAFTFLFRPFDDPHKPQLRNEQTSMHNLLQSLIKDFIHPSYIFMPYCLEFIKECFLNLMQKIQQVIQKNSINTENTQYFEEITQTLESLAENDKQKFYQFVKQNISDTLCVILPPEKTIGYLNLGIYQSYPEEEDDSPDWIKNVKEEFPSEQETQNQAGLIKEGVDHTDFIKSQADFREKYVYQLKNYFEFHDENLQSALKFENQTYMNQIQYLNFQIPQITRIYVNISEILILYKTNHIGLELRDMMNSINKYTFFLQEALQKKFQQTLQNTYQDGIFMNNGDTLKKVFYQSSHFYKWNKDNFKEIRFVIDQPNNESDESIYMKELKSFYQKYFKAAAFADQSNLFRKTEGIEFASTLVTQLSIFIRELYSIFIQIIKMTKIDVIKKGFNETKALSKDGADKFLSEEQDLNLKLTIITKFYSQFPSRVEAATISIPEAKNDLDDSLSFSLVRFGSIINSLVELARNSLFALKIELDYKCLVYLLQQSISSGSSNAMQLAMNNSSIIMSNTNNSSERSKEFSSNNVTQFYQEIFFYSNILATCLEPRLVKFIAADFEFILQKCLKAQFQFERKSKISHCQSFLRDVALLASQVSNASIFDMDHQQLEGLVATLVAIQNYMTLQLVEEKDLFDFLKENNFQYSVKQLDKYFKTRPLKDDDSIQQREEKQQLIRKFLL